MRPGQNKRLRGRNNGRKGPNPLTRSFESNGPEVKIRGTAQHVAEKYLQLARDAQTSGDIVMAENLLQHAEHYFRLIAAAQQQANPGYGRQSFEAESDVDDDDDDFTGIPDRFAPLAERLPPPAFPQQQPTYSAPQPQPQVQPHFAQPQPQPFEERPFGEQPRHERPNRPERQQFRGRPDRNQDRGGPERGQDRGQEQNAERGGESGERGPRMGFDRNRDRNRYQQRVEPPVAGEQPPASDIASPVGLPAFITTPPAVAVAARPAPFEVEAPAAAQSQRPDREQEGAGYHLAPRRRRRPRPPGEESREDDNGSASPGELPLGD
ncbi:MAG: DUF4167 domain-containing protein [Methylocystis sp.]